MEVIFLMVSVQARKVFKSSDNGTNWNLTNTGITSSWYINTLVYSNPIPLAGTDYGIFGLEQIMVMNGIPLNNGLTSIICYDFNN